MPKPRVSTLILIIALVVASFAAVNFYMGRNEETSKRVWAEDQLQKITLAKQALEQERDELIKAKQALEGQLTDATSKAQALADQIAQEKRAREALTTEMAQVRRETAEIRGRLEGERKEKLTLTEDLAKAKQSYQALSNELTTLRQAKEALEKRVKQMLTQQASEAERIVVRPTPAPVSAVPAAPAASPVAAPVAPARTAPAAATPGSTEGKVLVVNREFNFVVVNLGSRDGLKTGTALSIWRSNKAIAKAQVEKLYENMAAATILPEEQKEPIREGDLVQVAS